MRRLATSLALAPFVASYALLGDDRPIVTAALGLAGLAALALAARARVIAREPIAKIDVALALAIAIAFGGAVLLGGTGGFFVSKLEPASIRLARSLVGIAALAIALFAARPWLSLPIDAVDAAPIAERPSWVLPAIVLPAAIYHAALFFSFPPLLEIDSYVNLWEPTLFRADWRVFHHTPLYAQLVKGIGSTPHTARDFAVVVAAQHALAIAAALAAERAVRRETGRAIAAALAGVLVALDGQLAIYSQAIMTESIATALVVFSAAMLVEARHRLRPHAALVLAGVLSALATLTRQAMEAWFLCCVFFIVIGPLRPRARAVSLFLAGAIAPLLLLVAHNYTFQGRAVLTAATGRALLYRLAYRIPELTDPDAPPGDELERARRIVWANREKLWDGPYEGLRKELGWSDEQIDRTMQRFYVEQIERHPREFIAVTLDYTGQMFYAKDPLHGKVEFHNKVVSETPDPSWAAIGKGDAAQGTLLDRASDFLSLTSWPPIVWLAVLAPVVAFGPSRRLAIFALCSTLYMFLICSLAQIPMSRFRVPAGPFVAIGAGAGLAALVAIAKKIGAREAKP